MTPRGRWWPSEGEQTLLEIRRDRLPTAFLTAVARRREPVHIAFPIALVRPKDENRPPFVLPVATVAADWTLDDERLCITYPQYLAEVGMADKVMR